MLQLDTNKNNLRLFVLYSYLFLGGVSASALLSIGFELLVSHGNTSGVGGIIGFVILLPLDIPMMIALVLSVVLTLLFFWRDLWLISMALLTPATFYAVFWIEMTIDHTLIILGIYAIICINVCLPEVNKHLKQNRKAQKK